MCRAWLVVAVVAVLACATVAKMPRLEDRCTPCTQVGRLQYKALQTVQQQAGRKGRAEPADGDGDGEGSGQDDGESGGGEEDAIIGKDTAGEEEESEEEEIGSGGEKVEGRRDREGGNLEEGVDSEDVVGEAEGGEVEAESEGGGEVCGTDGASYSSLCTLQLAGCTRNWNIRTAPACPGRCPGLNLGRFSGNGQDWASNGGHCLQDHWRCLAALQDLQLLQIPAQTAGCCRNRLDRCREFVLSKPWTGYNGEKSL